MRTTGPPTERSFGSSIGMVTLALGAVCWWRGYALLGPVLLSTGTLLVSLGLTAPAVLRVPNRVWWRFAQLLGRVNARILLSVFFLAVLAPTGLVMRLFGRNMLSAWRTQTNWRPYPARRGDPKHFEHLF